MADPYGDVDREGLSERARSWTPKGLKTNQDAEDALDCLADALADALNPVIDMENYLPIILNPTRCGDNDINRSLNLTGIERNPALSNSQARRLAILGNQLRAWRGAFRSHRPIAGALTGGPVIIRPYLLDRFILDESSMDLVELDDTYSDLSQIFVLGQGPSGQEYDESQVRKHLENLAMPALDEVELVPCFVLTAWRDGLASGWSSTGETRLVGSTVFNEYEALDIGPNIDAAAVQQWLTGPTLQPDHEAYQTIWHTIWFKTGGATPGSYWEAHAMLSDPMTGSGTDSYCIRVYSGNYGVEFYRVSGGTYILMGSHPFTISDGLSGTYHRLDWLINTSPSALKMRVYVDGDSSSWFSAFPSAGGLRTAYGMDVANFPTGLLRVSSLTGSRTYVKVGSSFIASSWVVVPTTVPMALCYLAGMVNVGLCGGLGIPQAVASPTDWVAPAPSSHVSAVNRLALTVNAGLCGGLGIPVSPCAASDWVAPAPTTDQEAIDRLAAIVNTGLCGGLGVPEP